MSTLAVPPLENLFRDYIHVRVRPMPECSIGARGKRKDVRPPPSHPCLSLVAHILPWNLTQMQGTHIAMLRCCSKLWDGAHMQWGAFLLQGCQQGTQGRSSGAALPQQEHPLERGWVVGWQRTTSSCQQGA